MRKLAKPPCKADELDAFWTDNMDSVGAKCKDHMVKHFSTTWIGPGLIQPFAHTIPWIEMVMGALLIVGLFTRPALVVGGLLRW